MSPSNWPTWLVWVLAFVLSWALVAAAFCALAWFGKQLIDILLVFPALIMNGTS